MQPRPTHHQLIITILALVLIGGALWWYGDRGTTNHQTTETPLVADWSSREVRKETITEENQYYSITASYPVTSDARITDQFKQFVEAQIAQFKEDTAWATDPSIESASAGSLSLSVDYREVEAAAADTYVFTIATYTGGAHGLQVTRTFAYDRLGTPISLATLFTNGEAGLNTVATFVQNELTKKNISDETWISEGAAPTVENYQSFIISDEGVTFVFDPYQVAPYAAGTQNILVPTTVFKSIANPDLFVK